MYDARPLSWKNPKRLSRLIIKYCKKLGFVGGLVSLLLLFAVGSQIERFVSHGTILGYTVRRVPATTKAANRALGQHRSADNIACKKLPQKDVSSILGVAVDPAVSFVPDSTKQSIVSSCVYRTSVRKDTALRTAAITYRETADAATAMRIIDNLKKQNRGESVANVADQAYFLAASNQLTATKGLKVVTITVSRPTKNEIPSRDAAIKLAQVALAH